MLVSAFIFSNKPLPRIARHLVFWGLYYLRFVLLALPDVKIKTLTGTDVYSDAFQNAINFLPVYLFAVYVTLYFILPKYLAKRNILFLALCILSVVIITLLSAYCITVMTFINGGEPKNELDIELALRRSITSLIAISSSAVIMKIMKDYFFKQRENERLSIENARNKLQLLKMQIHPRILFECLHNIYNDIDAGTLYAPEMILKLSELLSYLLYEGELKQVPLTKEIKMLQAYFELKKLEYKNKIEIDFEVSGEMDTHYILSVLLLPLLEIAIIPPEKLEKVLTVFLELKTIESKLYFNLKTNISGTQVMKTPAAQIALDSTKRRLQTSGLYKFKLEFQSASNSFAIILLLEPDKFSNLKKFTIQNEESIIYERV